jgi:hypothetical protein
MTVSFEDVPSTELDAVNSMLLSIGKAPVSTLAVPGINDVSFATTKLYSVVRDVQSTPWWFNFEPCFPITPDGSGNIVMPTGALAIDVSDRVYNYVERYNAAAGSGAMCLYDRDHQTFNIGQYLNGQPLKVDVTWIFPFEHCPQAARRYMATRAGREFQTEAVGSQILYQFTKEKELEARAEMERADLKRSHTNMFSAPTRNNRIFNRQPGAFRRTW